jgi:hypothetical protein
LEILENPQTKVKIVDLIKVTRKSGTAGDFFLERKPARDFTINDVELRLTDIEVFINGKSIGKACDAVSGANIYFRFPERGLIVMSPFPRPGFDLPKIGVIENNVIKFASNGDDFRFVSSSPILGNGGKWNLWILHDPGNKSVTKSSAAAPFECGATDRLDFILRKGN